MAAFTQRGRLAASTATRLKAPNGLDVDQLRLYAVHRSANLGPLRSERDDPVCSFINSNFAGSFKFGIGKDQSGAEGGVIE